MSNINFSNNLLPLQLHLLKRGFFCIEFILALALLGILSFVVFYYSALSVQWQLQASKRLEIINQMYGVPTGESLIEHESTSELNWYFDTDQAKNFPVPVLSAILGKPIYVNVQYVTGTYKVGNIDRSFTALIGMQFVKDRI